MMNIENTKKIIEKINTQNINIIAISKYQTDADLEQLLALGINDFGESTQQNLSRRKAKYPQVNWHFIGRIQSNKIKRIVQDASLIHSVSKLEHLNKINSEAEKINKVQNILLQINISNEESKSGIQVSEIEHFSKQAQSLKNVALKGFMVIGRHTEDKDLINECFQQAHLLFAQYSPAFNLEILSMGMSNDYELAIANGATDLRLGSILFS